MFGSMMKKSKKIAKPMEKQVKSVLENKGGHIND